MISFSKLIKVSKQDLDELNHVNNVKYVEWIQKISAEHWKNAVDTEQFKKYVWVVRNHNITYCKSALLGDYLSITTYVSDWRGVISFRNVEMKNNKTNELLVTAKTEWCMLDAETLKPKRIPEEIIHRFQENS